MNEKKFGQRLKQYRLNKGYTKEEFCEDGSHLSTRQLTRLESGEAQPTLATLEYLSSRLNISLVELMGEEREDRQELPVDYLKLKYKLLRTPIYGNPAVIEELEKDLDRIFEYYYDDLPQEEQWIVDILQSSLYTYGMERGYYGKGIIDANREKLMTKKFYSIDELLVLHLYKVYFDDEEIRSGKFDLELFDAIASALLRSIDIIPVDYIFLLRDTLILIPTVEVIRGEFRYFKESMQVLNNIMEVTQDFQKEPLLKMLEWKYKLAKTNEIEVAQQLYDEAKVLAHLFKNEFLEMKLQEEWEKDMSRIRKK